MLRCVVSCERKQVHCICGWREKARPKCAEFRHLVLFRESSWICSVRIGGTLFFLICAFIIVFYQTEEMSESSILVLEVQLESHSTEQATRRR